MRSWGCEGYAGPSAASRGARNRPPYSVACVHTVALSSASRTGNNCCLTRNRLRALCAEVLNACGAFVVASCSMAEIHGCGDEAKKKAREDWLHSNRPGGTVTGQSSTKPLKPQARNHLQSKLQVLNSFSVASVPLLITSCTTFQEKLGGVAHKGKKPTEKDQKSGRGGGTAGRGGGPARGGRGRGRGA